MGIGLPVVLPLHPRTRGAIERFGLSQLLQGMTVIPPVSHAAFLWLASRCMLIVADLGGVQEECTVLKKPLLVIRRSTERPEAVEAGFARLVAPELDVAAEAAMFLDDLQRAPLTTVPSPYGDGTASNQIAQLALTFTGSSATSCRTAGARV